LPPTIQLQLTAPAASDVLAVRPCAELGPLLYVTTIVQVRFGAVDTAAKPVALRDTGDRTDVKTTPTGFGVGTGDAVGAAGVAVAEAELNAAGTGVTAAFPAGMTLPS
jgi:hypothetical protein